ncbi:MAG TPA: DUF417 family protein [Flavisolibacter sp.]
MNREGEYKWQNIAWHEENNTYLFPYGLGVAETILPYLEEQKEVERIVSKKGPLWWTVSSDGEREH